jgi:hypothetical protein
MTSMTTEMALSGSDHRIDIHAFAKGFVAGLVARDVNAVYPEEDRDRRGFDSVIRLLDAKVDELKTDATSRGLAHDVVRIANELRPSNTGSFEGFESALRALQLTFATCPNPWYDEIAFSIPKTYALETINSLPAFYRSLIEAAAQEFVQSRGT